MPIRKILLCDDEPDIRKLGLISLRNVGKWEVIVASDGQQAVELAAREQPDLVLLDALMPGLDGPATLARLRARPETVAIPVVFLTGCARPEDVEAFLALGALGVIRKPFDPMRLPGQVREVSAALAEAGS